jgi:Flp pilus assembly pilin Flp
MRAFLADERGVTTVEYVIVLVLIAIAGLAAWKRFGETVHRKVGDSTDRMYQLDPGAV